MRYFKRSGLGWLIVIFAVLALPGSEAATGPGGLGLLLDLPGDLVTVRYSPGSLDRAAQVQERFDLMLRDFQSWSQESAALVIFLLSREEWEQSSPRDPYGVPLPMAGRALAMSAWGDEGTVELWQRLLGARLPTWPGRPMRGTPEQAASLAVGDLIGAVEAARILMAAAGYGGDHAWVEGVLAHAISLAVMQRHERSRLPEVQQIFAGFSSGGGGPAAEPLSASSSPPSLPVRLWFEAQYFAAARLVAEAEGKPPAKALIKQARRSGGTLRAADLVGRYPSLGQWLTSSFKPDEP